MTRILLDTNVLVYAFDAQDEFKQDRALDVLVRLESGGRGCISVQALAEFTNVVTRKLRPPVPPAQAMQEVERFLQLLTVFDLTPAIVLEAARGVRDHQLAYYDAQVWATARLNQVPVIFSEDFNVGATLESVRFVNPFAGGFKLDDWG
ncbi:MAG: PIN domain-containing protein [Chloroflexi bacterium]|nr:PIN domain-containing protein [Chloroflexota bacterium]